MRNTVCSEIRTRYYLAGFNKYLYFTIHFYAYQQLKILKIMKKEIKNMNNHCYEYQVKNS